MTNQELSALVAKAQAGSKQAMNDLIENCYQDLFFYAFKTVQNEDLAADITQDGCMDIIAKLSELREPAAFSAWARRIIHTRCSRYFRQTREITVEEDENGETIFDRLPDESEGVLPEQVQEDKEFRRTMQEMLDSLPAEQRTALLLYYYEKFSVGQIAEVQGVSEGTVKSRLNYGRKAVKTKVEEYEKKTGVRLHSIAPLPLLLLFLLRREKEAVVAKCAPAISAIPATVAATATGAGTAVATGAAVTAGAAAGTGIGLKIIAGIAAVAAAVGITVGSIAIAKNDTNDNPETTTATADIAVLNSLQEVWYGGRYSNYNDGDVLLLQKDGTVTACGITYQITSVVPLEGDLDIQYPETVQHHEQEGTGYRVSLFSPEIGHAQVDFLTGLGCPEPVVAFFYMNYLIDDIIKLAVHDTFSINPPISDPLPLDLLDGLIGTWEYLPIDNLTFDESFILNEDYTVTYQGQTYIAESIRVDEADEPFNRCIVYELSCDSEEGYTSLYIDFCQLSDGNYAAEMSALVLGKGSCEINHFYRPEDFADYQKIVLTEDNWQEYIRISYTYSDWIDEETGEYFAQTGTGLVLPEGAAPISYFHGDVYYTTTYDRVLSLPGNNRETIGHTTDLTSGKLDNTLVFGAKWQLPLWCTTVEDLSLVSHRHSSAEYTYFDFSGTPAEGAVMLVPNYEQMWAENVVGVIYLPVN